MEALVANGERIRHSNATDNLSATYITERVYNYRQASQGSLHYREVRSTLKPAPGGTLPEAGDGFRLTSRGVAFNIDVEVKDG